VFVICQYPCQKCRRNSCCPAEAHLSARKLLSFQKDALLYLVGVFFFLTSSVAGRNGVSRRKSSRFERERGRNGDREELIVFSVLTDFSLNAY